MPAHRIGPHDWRLIVVTIACGAQFACAMGSERTLINEGLLGAVFLERLPSCGAPAKYSGPIGVFHTTHPIALPSDLLARMLMEVHLLPSVNAREAASLATSPLTHEEAVFLAPQIAAALSRATPDQRIRFLVRSGGRHVEGVMFAKAPLLLLTLIRYQHRDGDPPVALDEIEQTSALYSAQHPQAIPQFWLITEAARPSISLDCQIAEHLTGRQVGSTTTQTELPLTNRSARRGDDASSPEDLDTLRSIIVRQAQEIQKLKEEVEALGHQHVSSEIPTPTQPEKRAPAPQPQRP